MLKNTQINWWFNTKMYLAFATAVLVICISFIVMFYFQSFEQKDFSLGVSFTKSYAQFLGLDWKQTYLAILDDLKTQKVKISVPWNEIEPERDKFVFNDYDWMIDEAEKRGVEVVLVLGRRTPRWPECHDPAWIKDFYGEFTNDRVALLLRKEIEHFKSRKNISMWQLENEPLLEFFGQCSAPDMDFLRREYNLLKTLDDRPVMITDSGELSSWIGAANVGDIFGTSIYKTTYNRFWGYGKYFFPPVLYNLKARFVRVEPQAVVISELQAEPWTASGVLNTSVRDQLSIFSADELRASVSFARRTGFKTAYLWGAEWWYWLKTTQNESSVWEAAKIIFKNE